MNAANAYDFAPHWNAQDLTDAVPLRLHQLIDFDGMREGARAGSANAASAAPTRSPRLRLGNAIALPLFSVR